MREFWSHQAFNVFLTEFNKESQHIFCPETSDWSGSYQGSSLTIIEKIKKHPGVVAVFEKHKDNAFSFKLVSLNEIS